MTDTATDTDETTGKRAVVLASGGMDSATAAYHAKERGYELYLLHTSYGQETEAKEFECAKRLAAETDAAEFLRVETSHLAAIGGSSLTDDELDVDDTDLDTGEQRSASRASEDDSLEDSEEIPTSYVPFRNANLLSMAVSYAEVNDCDAVFAGAHSEDFSGYPDCRPEFFDAFQRVVDVGTKDDTEIDLRVPFVEWSKTDIAEHGVELGVPYEHTWSCYRAEEPACGTCEACAFRLQAFRNVGVRDPIDYDERPEYGER